MNRLSAEDMAERLNFLLMSEEVRADIGRLLSLGVVVSADTLHHPTLLFTEEGLLRFLGVINGILDGERVVAAVFDSDTQKLLRFEAIK